MTLKYTLESLEGLDEGIAALYSEGANGYTLKVEGVVPQSKYDETNQRAVDATTEATRRRKTLERVTGKLGLENADGLDEKLAELLAGKGGKSDADQQAVIDQIKASHAKEITAANARLTQIQMNAARLELTAELKAAGFQEKAAKVFAEANMNRFKADDSGEIQIVSETGTPLAGSGDNGFAIPADLAKELAAAMPEFLVDKGKGGGGKPPASGAKSHGENPWKRESRNLTRQAEILKSDPTLAGRLKAEAGVK